MILRAFCLRVRAFTSPPICYSLASGSLEYFIGARLIDDAKVFAVGICAWGKLF